MEKTGYVPVVLKLSERQRVIIRHCGMFLVLMQVLHFDINFFNTYRHCNRCFREPSYLEKAIMIVQGNTEHEAILFNLCKLGLIPKQL